MADIFISYAREDRDRIKALAHALARQGWTVWWDREIPVGASWHEVIEKQLKSARCVVVAWSSASVKSRFVRDEAGRAADAEKLFPVLLEPVNLPLGFGAFHAEDLSHWRGDPNDEAFGNLCQALGRTPSRVVAPRSGPTTPPPPALALPMVILGAVALGSAFAVGVWWWADATPFEPITPPVAVAPAETDPPDTDIGSWERGPPQTAWCYQEDRLNPAADQFLLICLKTETDCRTVRGSRRDRRQTVCTLTRGLRSVPSWTDAGRGFGGSWFKLSRTQFGPPAPQL